MSESKTKNVVRSVGAGLFNGLALVLLNLLSRHLFLDYIGLDYLSVAQVIVNLLNVISFSELGLGGAVLYMLYRPVATADHAAVRRVLYLYRRFNRYVGLTVAVVGLAALPLLPYFIKSEVEPGTVVLIYLINLAAAVTSYLYNYRSVLLSAYQRDYVSSVITTGFSFVRVIVQCTLIYYTHDYICFLVAGVLFGIVQNAVIYFEVGRRYAYIRDLGAAGGDRELPTLSRELRHNVLSMASVKIAAIVINDTDTIVISYFNTLMVGLCANYTMITGYMKSFILIVQNTLVHSIGISLVEKNPAERYELFRKILLINTYIGGVTLVTLYLGLNDFIAAWIGTEYVLEPLTFFALVLNVAYAFMIATVWMFRDCAGLFTRVRGMLAANAGVNIVLSLVAGYYWGAAGVFFATLAADLVTDFWFDARVIFREIFSRAGYAGYLGFVLVNMLAVIALTLGLASALPSAASFASAAMRSAVGLVAYTVVFVAVYHRSAAFSGIVMMLRGLVARRF